MISVTPLGYMYYRALQLQPARAIRWRKSDRGQRIYICTILFPYYRPRRSREEKEWVEDPCEYLELIYHSEKDDPRSVVWAARVITYDLSHSPKNFPLEYYWHKFGRPLVESECHPIITFYRITVFPLSLFIFAYGMGWRWGSEFRG